MATTLLRKAEGRAPEVKSATPQRRGDIQALRAVAVGLVVLNHLWPEHLSGGFIGVDIFFVISGYLITSHLRREIETTAGIRLARFWARRAIRLLPAAMTVLLFSVLVTTVWLPVTNRQSAFDQIAAAGTYFLNWLLAASSLDYFAQGAALSPVTHYWSLSVEEQFYIVWPVLLLLGAVATRRRRTSRVRTTVLVATIALVGGASFMWAVTSVSTRPDAAYFETAGRAWEFAAGALIAFIPTLSVKFRALAIPAVWAAWGALALAAYFFGPESGVPGLKALVPVLATAAILWAGDIKHPWAPHDLTSFRPIQILGDISYSLYLWHWPLIIAAPFALDRDITAKDKLVVLALALMLAFVTKTWIEDPPQRLAKSRGWKPRWILLATAASMVLLLVISTTGSSAWGVRAHATAERVYALSLNPDECFGAQAVLSGATCAESTVLTDADLPLVRESNQLNPLTNGGLCMADRGASEIVSCSFGAAEGTQIHNVALIGDSHAGVWSAALNAIAEQRGLRITAYLASACAPTLDRAVQYPDTLSAAGCQTWREAAISAVTNDPTIDVVVTSSNDRNHAHVGSDGERTMDTGDGYVAAWDQWVDAGKTVVAINDVPQHPSNVPDCIAGSHESADPCTMPADIVNSPGPLAQAAAKMHSNSFIFLNYQSVFCDLTYCHSVIGGIPAYLDSDHINAAFSRSFAPELLKVLAFE